MTENTVHIDERDLEILFSSKENKLTGSEKIKEFNEFRRALVEYILKELFVELKWLDTKTFNVDEIREILNSRPLVLKEENIDLSIPLTFSGIHFPKNTNDRNDYTKLFRAFDNISFKRCHFHTEEINLGSTNVFFDDCTFHERWKLEDYSLLENYNNTIYQLCKFKEDVIGYSSLEEPLSLTSSQFNNCSFDKKLRLERLSINAPLFSNSDNFTTSIDNVLLKKCDFHSKFILNDFYISYWESQDTEFKEKVEFKEGKVEEFNVSNSNFGKLFDAYGTTFTRLKFFKCIFRNFVGFEKCEFGSCHELEVNSATFKYVTFLDFTNFRSTQFYSGLDFENTNLKEPPNFLNAKVSFKNTNRETFRIIKHSFDNLGNYVEANKYFVYEMSRYEEELDAKSSFQEKLIFRVNKYTSNFGQSYLRALACIFLIALAYAAIIYSFENEFLYKIYPPFNGVFHSISFFVNSIFSNIPPFNKFLIKGMEFISLIFHLIFIGLFWQFVNAIKRNTKR